MSGILLGGRRSSLQGVLIQPSLISEDSAGWDDIVSSFTRSGTTDAEVDQAVSDIAQKQALVRQAPLETAEASAVSSGGSEELQDSSVVANSQMAGCGFYAPITAQAFGMNMHTDQCGCEGCLQSGVVAQRGLGALPSNNLVKIGLALALGVFLYNEIKKGKAHSKGISELIKSGGPRES